MAERLKNGKREVAEKVEDMDVMTDSELSPLECARSRTERTYAVNLPWQRQRGGECGYQALERNATHSRLESLIDFSRVRRANAQSKKEKQA